MRDVSGHNNPERISAKRRWLRAAVLVAVAALLIGAHTSSAAAPTQTPRPTNTLRPSITPRPTRTPRPSATPTVTPTFTNTPAPLTGKILFLSNRTNSDPTKKPLTELFVTDADGSNVTQLTHSKAWGVFSAVWSPDGSQIAYTEPATLNPGGYYTDYTVYVMNADGSDPKGIHAFSVLMKLAWSPDGKKLAFGWDVGSNLARFELTVMNVDGTDVKQLTFTKDLGVVDVAWSPDSKQIVFVSSGRGILYTVNADGSDLKRLTNKTDDEESPAWSADGTRILYFSDAAKAGFYDIYSMKPDGTDITRLSQANMQIFVGAVAWSADRSRVIIGCGNEKSLNLCAIDADGNNRIQITHGEQADVPADWSPSQPTGAEPSATAT